MSYHINLEKVTIEFFREWLKTSNLIPGWMILRENMDYLDTLKKLGIVNLDQVRVVLKSKANLHEFSGKSGIPEDYLTVLRRVVNGFHPKPNKIKDFPKIAGETVRKLKEFGMTNTLKLFEHIDEPGKRAQFGKDHDLSEVEVDNLWKLADLSRIKWVNHTFAYVLKEAGYESLKNVADADHEEMYQKVKELNHKQKYYRGTIGSNDFQRCVESAQMVLLFS